MFRPLNTLCLLVAGCMLLGDSWGWQQPVPASRRVPRVRLESNRGGYRNEQWGNNRPFGNEGAYYDNRYPNNNNYDAYYQEMGDRFDRQQYNRPYNGRDMNRDQIGSASHWSNNSRKTNPRSSISGEHQELGPVGRRRPGFWNEGGFGREGYGRGPVGRGPVPWQDDGSLWDNTQRRGRSSSLWNNNRGNTGRVSTFNSENHETMGPPPQWESPQRRARSADFWANNPNNRQLGYRNEFDDRRFMGNMGNQFEPRRNVWRPQRNFFDPNFEGMRNWADELGRGLNSFNPRGWNPRSRRSDYETGITGPISSEKFQKGINQQQTMGPKPASEYRRRLERERLKSQGTGSSNFYPERSYYDQREDFPPYFEEFPDQYPEEWREGMPYR